MTMVNRRFRVRVHGEQGSVAAEFAVTLPAVLVVLALAAGVMTAQTKRIVLQDAVADAARLVARGDEARGMGLVPRLVPGASAELTSDGDVDCVEGNVSLSIAGIPVTLSARSCALGGGL